MWYKRHHFEVVAPVSPKKILLNQALNEKNGRVQKKTLKEKTTLKKLYKNLTANFLP